MTNKKSNKKLYIVIIMIILLIAFVPLFTLKGAEFVGSDDAGSNVVEAIQDGNYVPWSTPVLEQLIGGEIPGEIESLLFCIQTGIGVGIIAYSFGYLVARKKYKKDEDDLR